ncbi:DUF4190 domain-containing protein [Nocardia sp. NPDC052566]|uniref:DUF4190 domain-containing protein n=1 Tax=Nocardia sp. NPDC052566 TaxID=3364330 RepID=UPI0037C7D4C1
MNYPQQPYGYPAYGPPPDHPQATTVLILGILSLVVCGVLGPFAWVMGKRALDEIDASGGAVGGRGNVQAGYICGIIGSVMLLLAIVSVVVFVILPLILVSAGAATTY